uniref:Uncharacterized protein n=1 Tax=Triticum urartu TaxID=4572 RepID=A0A8R7QL16_TRIUA
MLLLRAGGLVSLGAPVEHGHCVGHLLPVESDVGQLVGVAEEVAVGAAEPDIGGAGDEAGGELPPGSIAALEALPVEVVGAGGEREPGAGRRCLEHDVEPPARRDLGLDQRQHGAVVGEVAGVAELVVDASDEDDVVGGAALDIEHRGEERPVHVLCHLCCHGYEAKMRLAIKREGVR